MVLRGVQVDVVLNIVLVKLLHQCKIATLTGIYPIICGLILNSLSLFLNLPTLDNIAMSHRLRGFAVEGSFLTFTQNVLVLLLLDILMDIPSTQSSQVLPLTIQCQ